MTHQLTAPSEGMPPMCRKNLGTVQVGLPACLRSLRRGLSAHLHRCIVSDNPHIHPCKAGRHPAMTGRQCRFHRHLSLQMPCQATYALRNKLSFNTLRR
jgi:hypothetical protein